MKLSSALSVVLVVLPAFQEVSAGMLERRQALGRRQFGGQFGGQNKGGQFGGQNKGNQNQNNQNKNQNAAQNNQNKGNQNQNNQNQNNQNKGNQGNNNQNNGNQGNNNQNNGNQGNDNQNNNEDPQQSLTLNSKVIAPGFAQDGQDPPVDGQVASLTSKNNFINYCLTVPGTPITNGQQIQGGSCNPAPMGVIPSVDKMPSSKFVFPKNTQTIKADQTFTFQMAIQNLVTGNFVNAQKNYFAAPQFLQGGVIVGHSHITCDKLTAIDQTTPNNPKEFAFFKGLNDKAQNGILTATVDGGLPAGAYRCCSINSSANHTPAIAPVAQHGPIDDCSYFTATANGQAAGGNNTGNNNNAGGNNNTGNNNAGGNNNTGNNNTGGNNNQGGNNQQGGNKGAQNGGQGGNKGAQNAAQGGNKGAQNGAQGGNKGAQNNKGANNAGRGGAFGNRFGQGRGRRQ